ncbi:lipopolysaccharide biosynthesis protein [Enterococcus casseliflavus]|uniref:lipopolysaccharide biosynthesis protein n=1 Tax=Enterococcus casseliflavus TaxID=37734 RepID=UPI001E406DC9|nr:hypothetical protein [Enterococcus casseliflavus]MCD4961904.1 hypothetical protein [Enterococcus casseliflavus]
MNSKTRLFIKNIYYAVSANLVTLVISIVLNLLVPKSIGIREFSYWQLYIFYTSYVGFLQFGWIDGIYLRIGGENYDDIDKYKYGSQFWYILVSQILLSGILICFFYFNIDDFNKYLVIVLTLIGSVIVISKSYIQYILQSTNRIKEYAKISREDRYYYIIFVLIYLSLGFRSFIGLIVLDIAAKTIITLVGIWILRDKLFVKILPIEKIVSEIKENIRSGLNLMLGNIANLLIIGITRILIEQQWDIETFGKVSLTISISNMLLIFFNAVGVVIFPLISRINNLNISLLFQNIRNIFIPISFSTLLIYFPLKIILEHWLPQYHESILYMGILFPLIIYEGRMSFLVLPFLKAKRKEKTILFVNLITLILSIVISLITIFLFKSITFTLISIVFNTALRTFLSEKQFIVSKIVFIKNVIIESLLTCTFIIITTNFDDLKGMSILILAFLIYLIFNKRTILLSIKKIREIII